MSTPKIWADFNRVGGDLLVLDTQGTQNDLRRKGVVLREGMRVCIYMEDQEDGQDVLMNVVAIVTWDNGYDSWIAKYSGKDIKWTSPEEFGDM